MKKVTLEKIIIQNFKGIKALEQKFSERTKISGGNAKKKSTIYQAYLFALSGKDAKGEVANIQPRGEDKEIIPDLTTFVEIHLLVDKMPISFKREKAKEFTYFVNDVPCKKAEYDAKLNDILDLETWLMISNINSFNRLKMQDRRATLQKIASTENEIDLLLKDFETIREAKAQGKSVLELKREVKAKKDKSKDVLSHIPARMNEADSLKTEDVDINEVNARIEELETKLRGIDNAINNVVDVETNELINSKRKQINEIADKWQEKTSLHKSNYNDEKNSIISDQAKLTKLISDSKESIVSLNKELTQLKERLERQNKSLLSLREQYEEMLKTSEDETCSCCGQKLTAENLKSKKEIIAKKDLELRDAAQKNQENRHFLITEINKYIRALADKEELIKSYSEALDDKNKELENITPIDKRVENDSEINSLIESKDLLTSEIENLQVKDNNEEVLKAEKLHIQEKITAQKHLVFRHNENERIENKKIDIQKEQRFLVQEISTFEKIEKEIKDFQKREIEIIEENISSYFEIVKWKMFEQNLTNDDQKPICDAYVNGIPAGEQNEGMTMAIGVDIINGLSKANNISVPLFVDRYESVEKLPNVDAQLITLEVVKGQELIITNL